MKSPIKIKQRKYLDPKLGIKSSLSDIRVAIATLYVFYVANDKQSTCQYSVQNSDTISLSPNLAANIRHIFNSEEIIPLVEKSPLFKSQFESLLVFMSLIYSLGAIKFNQSRSDSVERTGNIRYEKTITFSANMMIIDAIISSYTEKDINDFIYNWLNNQACNNEKLEQKVKQTLQIFSEQTVYKLRVVRGDDIVLQTEGLYDAIESSSDEIDLGDSEIVGPFRIIKSALDKGLNPYLHCKNKIVTLNPEIQFSTFVNYRDMVSTLLDISRRDITEAPTKESKAKIVPITSSTIYRPFITAIKSKPFLLLAGISGTGKSRIVRELARACWEVGSEEYEAQKPRNFEMVQVKPNWHDSTELLGYVSRVSGKPEFVQGDFLRFIVKAWEEPDVPFFLCLDEMNLAPVEQYFAEYLSVIESRKVYADGKLEIDPIIKEVGEQWYIDLVGDLGVGGDLREQFLKNGISLPQNLIVIGTVNMDETTYSFSRKVLDRAMTIEMNEFDIRGGLERENTATDLHLNKDDLIGSAVEGKDVYSDNKEVCEIALNYLSKVNEVLKNTPFAVAYRTRNEFLLYVVNNLPYNKDEEGNDLPEGFVIARALDEITSMKMLSRIEGDDTKVSEKLLSNLHDAIDSGLREIYSDGPEVKSISLAKIDEMKRRLLSSGYTSYWS